MVNATQPATAIAAASDAHPDRAPPAPPPPCTKMTARIFGAALAGEYTSSSCGLPPSTMYWTPVFTLTADPAADAGAANCSEVTTTAAAARAVRMVRWRLVVTTPTLGDQADSADGNGTKWPRRTRRFRPFGRSLRPGRGRLLRGDPNF